MSRAIDEALSRLSSEVDATLSALRPAPFANPPAGRSAGDPVASSDALSAAAASAAAFPVTESGSGHADLPDVPAPPAPTVYAPPPPAPGPAWGTSLASPSGRDADAPEPMEPDAPEEVPDVKGAPEGGVQLDLPIAAASSPRRLDWLLRRFGL